MPAGSEPGARRRRRLSRSGEFDRVYRQGRSHASRFLVVYAFPRAADDDASPDDDVRLGVSVGRKVGGAVERNKVKRALRDAFWSLSPALATRHDVVLVARPELAPLVESEGGAGVERELRALLAEAGLEGPARDPSPGDRST